MRSAPIRKLSTRSRTKRSRGLQTCAVVAKTIQLRQRILEPCPAGAIDHARTRRILLQERDRRVHHIADCDLTILRRRRYGIKEAFHPPEQTLRTQSRLQIRLPPLCWAIRVLSPRFALRNQPGERPGISTLSPRSFCAKKKPGSLTWRESIGMTGILECCGIEIARLEQPPQSGSVEIAINPITPGKQRSARTRRCCSQTKFGRHRPAVKPCLFPRTGRKVVCRAGNFDLIEAEATTPEFAEILLRSLNPVRPRETVQKNRRSKVAARCLNRERTKSGQRPV